MSGHSAKKAKKSAGTAKIIYLSMISFSTAYYLLIHLYRYFISKREDAFSKKEIIEFIILSLINFILYRLLNKSDGTEEEEELNNKNNNKFKDSGHQTKQIKEKKQKVKYVKH